MIIDGKKIAQGILDTLPKQSGKRVAFVSFLNDFRSRSFMNIKTEAGKRIGVHTEIVEAVAETTEKAIEQIEKIQETFDGVVVQLPLPKELDREKILTAIAIEKDIDVLSASAIAAFKEGKSKRMPPVAGAVWEVLGHSGTALQNSRIIILGKGKLVGAPVIALFDREKIEYQAFDIASDAAAMKTALLAADVIIAGLGQPHFVKPDMIQEGIILIDCGTSESAGKLAGDIDPACASKASRFTPVPGGIGPITVACLYRNLFEK